MALNGLQALGKSLYTWSHGGAPLWAFKWGSVGSDLWDFADPFCVLADFVLARFNSVTPELLIYLFPGKRQLRLTFYYIPLN
jgi:hypothetical protein